MGRKTAEFCQTCVGRSIALWGERKAGGGAEAGEERGVGGKVRAVSVSAEGSGVLRCAQDDGKNKQRHEQTRATQTTAERVATAAGSGWNKQRQGASEKIRTLTGEAVRMRGTEYHRRWLESKPGVVQRGGTTGTCKGSGGNGVWRSRREEFAGKDDFKRVAEVGGARVWPRSWLGCEVCRPDGRGSALGDAVCGGSVAVSEPDQ